MGTPGEGHDPRKDRWPLVGQWQPIFDRHESLARGECPHSGFWPRNQAGNLWVENYRLPADSSAPRHWSVFGRDGLWLGDLQLPRGLRVCEIGDGHIAGLERDDMEVEYVKVYRLEKR